MNDKLFVEVFKTLFPVGTKKEFVDEVLIGAGNAKLSSSDDLPNTHQYLIPEIVNGFGRGGYWVIYDKKDRLINIRTPIPRPVNIYPDQITIEDLIERQRLKYKE